MTEFAPRKPLVLLLEHFLIRLFCIRHVRRSYGTHFV